MNQTTKIKLPNKFKPLFHPARYKVFRGGRGGAKSRSFATALILKATQKKHLVLCTREFQNSIKDSVKKVLDNEIERLDIGDKFRSTQQSISCPETGSQFIFAGLFNNVDNIKSTEGVTICWVEEAQVVSQFSLDLLIPTIREEGSEIWFSYNPRYETDPVHSMFAVNEPPPDSLVVEVGYKDNPWFPQVLGDQMEYDKEHDYDKYRHIWLGECVTHSEAQVMHGIWQEVDDTPEPPDGTVHHWGLDFGFSVDPSALVRCWSSGRTLYIDREAYDHKVEIDDMPDFIDSADDSVRLWPIIADSSRPETISYLNRQGFNVLSSKKGKGSIEDGVQRIRSYRVVINGKNCPYTVEEFSRYSYKVDKKTGAILPILEDKWNHIIDALRMSLEGTDDLQVFQGVPERSIKEDYIDVVPMWWSMLGVVRYSGTASGTFAVLLGHDTDKDVIHLLKTYSTGELYSPVAMRVVLKDWGDVPWCYTSCGIKGDNASGAEIAEQFRKAGFSMVTNQEKDSLESGTQAVIDRMISGKFKANDRQQAFWSQFRAYTREDGKLNIADNTGVLDAVRAGVQNIKFSRRVDDYITQDMLMPEADVAIY